MLRFLVAGLIGFALAITACAHATPYDPFRVPPEQIRANVRVLAVGPLIVPRDLENPEPVKARFQQLIEAQFREAGYTIVGPGETRPVWDSLAAESHGLYDPVTGEPDAAKVRAFHDAVYRELKTRFGVDAMLLSALWVVPAKLEDDVARWDGTSQGAGRKKFWKAVLGVSHSGTIPALSLHVRLADSDDKDLYENRGGIQVLGKVGVENLQSVP